MTGPVTFTMNLEPLFRELDLTQHQQVPFALANALNRTVEEGQQAIRDRLFMRGFTVRSARSAKFLADSIRFSRGDRARKDKPSATLRIQPPGKGGGRSGLLGFLEGGGVRFTQFAIGSGSVFGPSSIAVPARQTPMEQIPRNLYPSQTGLQETRSIAGKFNKGRLRGKRGTFAVRTKPGEGLVLQRTGPGQRDTRVLFVIKPRVKVEGRHFFYSTFERVALERFDINMQAFMAQAIRTAR